MLLTKELKDIILERLKTKDLVRLPASKSEYFSVAFDLPFKIEYHESEIITMGLTTPKHEAIVSNLIWILNNLYQFTEDIFVFGSNTGVHVPEFEGGYYMPDVLVVNGELELLESSNCIILNPYIIIEVLSNSTTKFDTSEKFEEYKTIKNLHQIIFVSQDKIKVSSYSRTSKPNTWLLEECTDLVESIEINTNEITLKTIVRYNF